MHQKNKKFLTGLIAVLLATGLYMGFNSDSTLFTGYLAIEETQDREGNDVQTIRDYLDSITNADTWGEFDQRTGFTSMTPEDKKDFLTTQEIIHTEEANEFYASESFSYPLENYTYKEVNGEFHPHTSREIITSFLEDNQDQIARITINSANDFLETNGIMTSGAGTFISSPYSGSFVDFYNAENYPDQNLKCTEAELLENTDQNILITNIYESLEKLKNDRKDQRANLTVNKFVNYLKENSGRRGQNKPFKANFNLDSDLNENESSIYSYEDLQKLTNILSQIGITLFKNGQCQNPQRLLPINPFTYLPTEIEISDHLYLNQVPQNEDRVRRRMNDLNIRYTPKELTYLNFQKDSSNGINFTGVELERIPDTFNLYNSEAINEDFLHQSPTQLYFSTDQNYISYEGYLLRGPNDTNLENIKDPIINALKDENLSVLEGDALGGTGTTVLKIMEGASSVQPVNGFANHVLEWDKTCATPDGVCPTDRDIILVLKVKSEVDPAKSLFLEEPDRFSFLLLHLSHEVSQASDFDDALDFNDIRIIDSDNNAEIETGEVITITLPYDQTQVVLPQGEVKLSLREGEEEYELDCINDNTRNPNELVCNGQAPLTDGEYEVYVVFTQDESIIRDFTITVTGQDRTGDTGGDTGAGNAGDGGTQAGETQGEAVETTNSVEQSPTTAGEQMTVELELSDAELQELGIEDGSTVEVRLVDENGDIQATLTCTENAGTLNCTGDAPDEAGEYNVVVAVENNGEVTTHELQEEENGNTQNQSVEIQAPELEITSRPSQDIELHNAQITIEGSQLDNLDEANLSLVPTNNTVENSDFIAETLNPTNITTNNQGTQATLFFGDVFPGNYQLVHNNNTIINNVVVINPSIASPAQGDTDVVLKPTIAFGSLYTLTNSYRIDISTGGQNIYSKVLTANSQTDVITHVVENDLNPGSTYSLNVLPLFNESPVANVYNSVQFTTTSQAPVTNEQLRNVVLTCNNNENLHTDSTANCSFNLPPNATLEAGAKMRFQQSAESAVVQISGSRVDAAIPTPATAGNYYIEVLSADESSSTTINQQFTITVFGDQPADPADPANPDDPQGDTPVVKSEDLINVSRDKRIEAGESMDLKVKLAKDSDFNLAVVTLYKIEDLDEDADEDEEPEVEQVATLYYHCSESIEDDIDCPEYEEENLSGKKTLKINYDTSQLEAGNYIIQVFTQDKDSNTYVVEKSLKVRSSQVIPGIPTPPGQVSQCNQFFADMAPNDPQCYDVIFLRQYGLFNGQNINGMSVAQLQQTISRAEMFAILGKLYGFSQNYVNLQELAAYYTDISEKDAANPINQWWMVPLYHLTANQIITGYSDGTIKAAQSPTMAEFAKSIGQAVGFTTYLDTSKNPWYTDLVNMYYGYGVRFQPEMGTNRRGAVYLLSRTLQIIQNPSLNASYNPYQSNGFGYSAGYQAVPGGYNFAGYASNGYGVGTFNNQSQTSYNQYGYQGMNASGSYGNMQQMGYGAYGYAPYSQYQMTGF